MEAKEVARRMEIRRYLEILQRRMTVVVSTLVITLAIVVLGSFRMTPVYSAAAMVRIAEGTGGQFSYTDLNYSERLMNTYVQLLKSRPFLEKVIQTLGLPTQPEALANTIKVEAPANTELLRITAGASNPADAARIANALASLVVNQGQAVYTGPGASASQILQAQLASAERQMEADRVALATLRAPSPNAGTAGSAQAADLSVQQLVTKIGLEEQAHFSLLNQFNAAQLDESTRGNSLSIAEPAVEPLGPSQPRGELILALGFLVGLLGGLGLAFLFDRLDPTLHSADHLEAVAGVSLLGSIPEFKRTGKPEDEALSGGARWTPVSDAFRLLSANLMSLPLALPAANSRQGKTLLIAGAEPRAGKSTVLAGLAVALARTGRRVVVVDANLRHPGLHRLFGLSNGLGLVDALLNPGKLEAALQETKIPGVRALTSGLVAESSLALLSTPRVSELLTRLVEAADVVLVDSPAIVDSVDAPILAPLVDGVLLVAARGRATAPDVEKAAAQLRRVGSPLLGAVFTRTERGRASDSRWPPWVEQAASKAALDAERRRYLRAKRVMDVALSILALAVLSPVLLVIALLIKLDSQGPVIFSQERMGYDWRRRKPRTFALYKFRSMVRNADQGAHKQFIQEWIRGRKSSEKRGELVKLTNDGRVTRIGRFLRRASLDELPQLWNVLKGDMSLVGPRPVPLYEVEEYQSWHKLRLQVTPGITCLWQVKGRGLSNIDDMVRMDVEYMENQSLLLDLKLLLHTIPVVLTGRGAA